MKLFCCIMLSIFAFTSAEAVLPPLYETANEIKAMMMDEQLGQKLQSGEVIISIHKNDSGYEIVTNKHRMQVDIQYLPAERPGPAHYKLHFNDPTPLKEAKQNNLLTYLTQAEGFDRS